MTSRERVLKAINHKEPDRIPLDLNGHRSSGIMVQAYKGLRNYLGLPPSALFVYDFIQQLALVEDDVLDAVGADIVEISHDFYKKEHYWQDWQLQDGTPCKTPSFIKVERVHDGSVVYGDENQVICIQKNGSLYFEQTHFPLKDSDDMTFERLPYYLQQIMWCRIGIPPAPAAFDKEGLEIMRKLMPRHYTSQLSGPSTQPLEET